MGSCVYQSSIHQGKTLTAASDQKNGGTQHRVFGNHIYPSPPPTLTSLSSLLLVCRTILLSVISLLNEPNTFSAANVDASVLYRRWRDSRGKDKQYIDQIT